MSEAIITELLERSQQLLDAITAGDWASYEALCDPTLSAFEPEARGLLVEGLEFHRYYFQLADGDAPPTSSTMAAPHVRLVGDDAAVVCYVRLVQHLDADGRPQTSRYEETRVWERTTGTWRHVHFHRSANP